MAPWKYSSALNLLSKHFLPLDELPVSEGQSEKADMRILQASSQEVLSKNTNILSRGLIVDLPSIQQILNGEIPIVKRNNKQMFLYDFIENKADTPGGRFAQ